jgi:TRAP-type C4-dicarboxylate transport system substrate-binding protein
MNKKRFDGLSAEGRKAVTDNSGEHWARVGGKYFDWIQAEGRKSTAAMKNHTISVPTPEQSALYRKKLAHITADWVKNTPDGEKVLTEFRRHLAEVKAGK